ncbi:nuclear transport factor 2 family protein [Tahibacter harae]|uniref:Nuclear transport factor 2 family protein n=1 Tax=Tahibacter harae TaxID=2963937 RepID=A0ABT1QL90_9GAMM|nr:nuclear transport factor 2 family protein [Tahibacter harae]MCQ4163299.1 nuclear transport factor 2 family protein [Tahibacter harae]
MLHLLRTVAACAGLFLLASQAPAAPPATPQQAVDALLAADRAYAAASARTDLISGLSAMFADDVVMPVPGNRFARGAAEVRDYLRSVPDNAKSRLEWAPQRGGISADGQHGFTFGYMTLHKPDQSTQAQKYLAYWIRRNDSWRVVVYKRSRSNAAPAQPAPLPPALPAQLAATPADAAHTQEYARSLDQAERTFSDTAQRIGLGPAFAQYGSADAINLGGPDDAEVVLGADKIALAVGAGLAPGTSPVTWAPDEVIVAGSGDLGITIGFLQPNAGAADTGRKPVPFFTIWRRATTADPWRYVAE